MLKSIYIDILLYSFCIFFSLHNILSNRQIEFCVVWENDVLAMIVPIWQLTTVNFIANEFHSNNMNFYLASYILEKLLRDLARYLKFSNLRM